MTFPFFCWFLSIFYFKLFVAEYRPDLGYFLCSHRNNLLDSNCEPKSVRLHKKWKKKLVVYFFSKTFRCRGAKFSNGMLLPRGGSLLGSGWSHEESYSLTGTWCLDQNTKRQIQGHVDGLWQIGWKPELVSVTKSLLQMAQCCGFWLFLVVSHLCFFYIILYCSLLGLYFSRIFFPF